MDTIFIENYAKCGEKKTLDGKEIEEKEKVIVEKEKEVENNMVSSFLEKTNNLIEGVKEHAKNVAESFAKVMELEKKIKDLDADVVLLETIRNDQEVARKEFREEEAVVHSRVEKLSETVSEQSMNDLSKNLKEILETVDSSIQRIRQKNGDFRAEQSKICLKWFAATADSATQDWFLPDLHVYLKNGQRTKLCADLELAQKEYEEKKENAAAASKKAWISAKTSVNRREEHLKKKQDELQMLTTEIRLAKDKLESSTNYEDFN